MKSARTGPPPEKVAATSTESRQPRFGSDTNAKDTTTTPPRQLSRAEWLRIYAINSYDDVKAWADDADIPIVVLPVRDQTLASAAAWIVSVAAFDAGCAVKDCLRIASTCGLQ